MFSRLIPVLARQAPSQVLFARQAAVVTARQAAVVTTQFSRSFCTPAKEAPPAEEEEKPYTGYAHLQINSHSGRYAGNLFRTAEEHTVAHDDVLESLTTISQAIADDETLKMYLEDNSTKEEEKAETLGDLYLQLEEVDEECFIDDLAEEMVDFLINNKELNILPDVIADYSRMVLEFNKEVEATVTTAEAMTNEQSERVYAKLSKLAGNGQTVLMDTEVDPTILGGMTISFGESYQDLSVRAALSAAESEIRAI